MSKDIKSSNSNMLPKLNYRNFVVVTCMQVSIKLLIFILGILNLKAFKKVILSIGTQFFQLINLSKNKFNYNNNFYILL